MRIVKLKEFLDLPKGTLFCKYDNGFFHELMIKLDTVEGTPDYYYSDLYYTIAVSSDDESNLIYKAEKDSTFEIELEFNVRSRDGMFDTAQLYAVFTEEEKQKIKENI